MSRRLLRNRLERPLVVREFSPVFDLVLGALAAIPQFKSYPIRLLIEPVGKVGAISLYENTLVYL